MNGVRKTTPAGAVRVLPSGLFPRRIGVCSNASTPPDAFDTASDVPFPSSAEAVSALFEPDAPSGLEFNASTRINPPDFAVGIPTVATAAFAMVVAFKDR